MDKRIKKLSGLIIVWQLFAAFLGVVAYLLHITEVSNSIKIATFEAGYLLGLWLFPVVGIFYVLLFYIGGKFFDD